MNKNWCSIFLLPFERLGRIFMACSSLSSLPKDTFFWSFWFLILWFSHTSSSFLFIWSSQLLLQFLLPKPLGNTCRSLFVRRNIWDNPLFLEIAKKLIFIFVLNYWCSCIVNISLLNIRISSRICHIIVIPSFLILITIFFLLLFVIYLSARFLLLLPLNVLFLLLFPLFFKFSFWFQRLTLF